MRGSYERHIAATDTSTRGKTHTGEEMGIESAARASITAVALTLQSGGLTSVSPQRKGMTQWA